RTKTQQKGTTLDNVINGDKTAGEADGNEQQRMEQCNAAPAVPRLSCFIHENTPGPAGRQPAAARPRTVPLLGGVRGGSVQAKGKCAFILPQPDNERDQWKQNQVDQLDLKRDAK